MTTRQSLIRIGVLLLFTAACRPAAVSAAGDGDKAKTAPAPARITQPGEGAVLNGVVTLKAELKRNDRRAVVGVVSFYAGDQKVADACPGACHVNWDTRGVADGTYALTVRLSDYNRKTKKTEKAIHISEPVTVRVHNCEE